MSMTYAEIYTMINSIGYPACYNHFPEETAKAPPFICFYFPMSEDKMFDDMNYVKSERLYLELYVANKDFTAEAAVEAVLRENGLTYSRDETYIDSEKMYLELYTTEIIITEEKTNG